MRDTMSPMPPMSPMSPMASLKMGQMGKMGGMDSRAPPYHGGRHQRGARKPPLSRGSADWVQRHAARYRAGARIGSSVTLVNAGSGARR